VGSRRASERERWGRGMRLGLGRGDGVGVLAGGGWREGVLAKDPEVCFFV
jgi:hypothetical protein